MCNALKHRDLFGPRFPAAGRHISFLIPREHRGGAIDPLNFEESRGEWLQRRKGFQTDLPVTVLKGDEIVSRSVRRDRAIFKR